MYAIIQSGNVSPFNPNKFEIIRGDRADGGYPVGYEGKDWHRTEHVKLTIEQARLILKTLDK